MAADRPGRGATAAGVSVLVETGNQTGGVDRPTTSLPDSSTQPLGRVVEEALGEAVVDRNAGAAHRTGATDKAVWLGVVSESVVNGIIDCRRPQKPGLDRPEVQRGDVGAGQHRVAGAEVRLGRR